MARSLAMVLGVLAWLGGASQAAAAPGVVRVDVECEASGRTKACPAFLLGFIDANKVFLQAPRADADVVLHVSAIEVALHDRVHLRYVSTMAGPPPVVELDVELDTRDTDDAQRAKLEPAFLRGIALYVAARDPDLVTVSVAAAGHAADAPKPETSPWDLSLSLSGNGSWTGPYQSNNGFAAINVSRTTERTRAAASVGANGGISRQPPLQLPDGTSLSTDTSTWNTSTGVGGAYLFDDHLSVDGSASASRSDPHAQTRASMSGALGVEWDKYKANDPRGNRLSVSYTVGYEDDQYNLRDVLGETSARYASHSLNASGSVRKDKTSYSLSLGMSSEMFRPARRYTLSASPSITWQLGGHVDLNASFSIMKRQLPAPDPAAIDPMDYAQVSQLSYAQPLAISGSLGITFHWDRTNGARNDR